MRFAETVGRSNVHRAAAGVSKLLTLEMGRPASKVSTRDSAYWFEEHGSVIAFAAFRPWTEHKALFVVLAWTQNDKRQQGLYRQLFAMIQKRAKIMGYKSVLCGVAPTNELSQDVHVKLGMKPVMFEVLA